MLNRGDAELILDRACESKPARTANHRRRWIYEERFHATGTKRQNEPPPENYPEELLRQNPTRMQISGAIGLSLEGVKRNLGKLKASGIIRRIEPDRVGHWEVVD